MKIIFKKTKIITSLLVILFLSATAKAETFTVYTDSDSLSSPPPIGSLRLAISQANSNGNPEEMDEIVFSESVENILLMGALPVITESLKITGPESETLTINALGTGRVLELDSLGGDTSFEIGFLKITGGETTGSGGGIKLGDGDNLVIESCQIVNNSADISGGGLSAGANVTLTIKNTILTNNIALSGGGIRIYTGSSSVNIIDSIISLNVATLDGGGIQSHHNGSLSIINSTISENLSESDGGGIYTYFNDPFNITNSTISENKAYGNGGGIFSSSGSSVHSNVTLTLNQSDLNFDGNGTGGGIYVESGSVYFKNSILAANTDASLNAPECFLDPASGGLLISLGYNLIQDSTGCDIIPDDSESDTNIYDENTLLLELADNGGSTPTHYMETTSPIIDSGTPSGCTDAYGGPLETDQRGKSRYGPCDIGAVEFGSCGDGFWQEAAGEECDDGNNSNGDGCSSSCTEEIDADGDGHYAAIGGDCNDSDPTVYPGAPESCDNIDSNCNGSLVDFFDDFDGDNNPDCVDPDDDNDGHEDGEDCQPLNSAIYPGATEFCDTVDSDCDEDLVDDFDNLDGDDIPDCEDLDIDGDESNNSLDCNPEDATIYPGADEVPNDGIDQDCNDFDTVTCYNDDDGDGSASVLALAYLDPNSCSGANQSTTNTDCDDENASIYVGASEILEDGIDQDCNGADSVTCYIGGDGDGDGFAEIGIPSGVDIFGCSGPTDSTVSGDCNDSAPSIHPTATEISNDGIDQDCNGFDTVTCYIDGDNDGFAQVGGIPFSDDEGCIGDNKSLIRTDCNDANDSINPDAAEICDGIDNNCSSETDESFADTDGDGIADCVDGDDETEEEEDPEDHVSVEDTEATTDDTPTSSETEAEETVSEPDDEADSDSVEDTGSSDATTSANSGCSLNTSPAHPSNNFWLYAAILCLIFTQTLRRRLTESSQPELPVE